MIAILKYVVSSLLVGFLMLVYLMTTLTFIIFLNYNNNNNVYF